MPVDKNDWAIVGLAAAVAVILADPSLVATAVPDGAAKLWLDGHPMLQQFVSMPVALCLTCA